ncbi:universal stress protein [Halorussus limi]|uniref:Universal stress protein n=1 Tax=Halorussus limi TaxID=2938695 RepID=A0A8U0HYF6_9EURY|nr:universal stress protein [Halorussus limi]UPV75958.1 universal stress protein [Halorussus limi]
MYDRILLPTDGSRAAESAVSHAVSHAERYDAELYVLHVVDETETTSIVGHGDERQQAVEARVEDSMSSIVTEASQRGVSVTDDVEVGTPHRTILSYADERDIDLVVMSTHGRSGVDRVVMGSVTERVIRTGDVPVVAVQRE